MSWARKFALAAPEKLSASGPMTGATSPAWVIGSTDTASSAQAVSPQRGIGVACPASGFNTEVPCRPDEHCDS
jgi:hypothetical protein